MPGPSQRAPRAAVDAIARLSSQRLDPQELLEEAMPRIARVVGTEAFFAAGTDPETRLCHGAGVVAGMSDEICRPYWDHELLVPDFNKFAEIDPEDPVVDLHAATGGRPQRSARWRAFHAISDLDAELRAVLAVGGRVWGVLQLNRMSGTSRFTEEDAAFVREVAPLLGRGLRDGLLSTPADAGQGPNGPGVMILDESGAVVSATAEAQAWLDRIPGSWVSPRTGVPVPVEVAALAITAADGGAPVEHRRSRLRTADGVWLVAHASALPGTGQIVVVIEPAKASEIAPVIVEVYGLTPREVEVTHRIARGLRTAEIGAELHLSPHTVRDHVKAIFEKVGVSSRGELTSKLFAEHYRPTIDAPIRASERRVAAAAGLL